MDDKQTAAQDNMDVSRLFMPCFADQSAQNWRALTVLPGNLIRPVEGRSKGLICEAKIDSDAAGESLSAASWTPYMHAFVFVSVTLIALTNAHPPSTR